MRAAALLPLLLLAGCVSPAPAGERFTEICLGLPMGVEWHQPGLHDALPDAARAAGLVATESLPRAGYPFLSPPAGLEGARLVAVIQLPARDVGPSPPMVAVEIEPDGTPRVFLDGAKDDAHAAAVFRAFLGALGLGAAPGVDAWERALLAGRVEQVRHHYMAVIELPLSADAAYALVEGHGEVETRGQTGSMVMRAPGWQLILRAPTRSVVVGEGFDRMVLTTDASGRVHGEGLFADRDEDSDALLARLQEGFGRLGLPEPTFHGLSRGDARC